MKWTKMTDRLPPEPTDKFDGSQYLATVANNQVVALRYVRTTVRNKEVLRWEWNGRICSWDIIAWMPFPKGYTEEDL